MKRIFKAAATTAFIFCAQFGLDAHQIDCSAMPSSRLRCTQMEEFAQLLDSLYNRQEENDFAQPADSLIADSDFNNQQAENDFAQPADSLIAGSDFNNQQTENDFAQPEMEPTDSLLLAWYENTKQLQYDNSLEELDSVKFTSQVPDSVYIERIKDMNAFFQLPYNEIVRNYIILYSEKMKGGRIEKILGMCNYYMPIFEETMDRYDIPEELKVMSIIESSLNPVAVSRAGARGLWQFMYSTAKIYGLEINSFVDERLDPFKAADAAARYLRDSYMIFGDWNLAIASYNCGPGNVNKAIRRSGGHKDFWEIWPYLPRETRSYVPAFVGALYTLNYYKEHGIRPDTIEMPTQVDTFKVNKMLHFKQINEVLGVPVDVIKTLNPQYKHEIIPGNEKEYILRLPAAYTNGFIEHQDTLFRHRADSLFNPLTIKKIKEGGDGELIIYKVKNGDYLGRIASRYGCSVNQIKKWNGLKSNNIRVGQKLRIYRGGRAPVASSTTSSSAKTTKPAAPASGKAGSSSSAKSASATATQQSAASSAQQAASANAAAQSKTDTSNWTTAAVYTVKQGDSLYSIAKNYDGVSAQDIMAYNGISSSIRPGMKINIPKKQ